MHAQYYDYVCPTCEQPDGGDAMEKEHISLLPSFENVIDEVDTFNCLGDVVERDEGVERPVCGKMAAAWCESLEFAGLLCNPGIPFRSRSSTYEACIRSVMFYDSEA